MLPRSYLDHRGCVNVLVQLTVPTCVESYEGVAAARAGYWSGCGSHCERVRIPAIPQIAGFPDEAGGIT